MRTGMNHWRSAVLAGALLTAICAVRADGIEQHTPDDKAIHAFSLAYQDFSGSLAEQVGTKGNPEILAFVSKMSNYRVEFEETPSHYRITFYPLPYRGGLLQGGGAEYRVLKATGKLEVVERFE